MEQMHQDPAKIQARWAELSNGGETGALILHELEMALSNGDPAHVIASSLFSSLGPLAAAFVSKTPVPATGSPLLEPRGLVFMDELMSALRALVAQSEGIDTILSGAEAEQGLFGSQAQAHATGEWTPRAGHWLESERASRPEAVDPEPPGGIFNVPEALESSLGCGLVEPAARPGTPTMGSYFEPEAPGEGRIVGATIDSMMAVAVQDAYTMLTRRVLYEGGPPLSHAEKAWCQRAELLLGAVRGK